MGRQKKKSKSPASKRRSARDKAKSAPQSSSNGRNERINKLERATTRASKFGSTLVHLGVVWAVCAGLALLASRSRADRTHSTLIVDGYSIPQELSASWTEYPNPLNITDADRDKFHPVVKFPKAWKEVNGKRQKVDSYRVLDHTVSSASAQLATEEERQLYKTSKTSSRRVEPLNDYAVGRYDENRINLYKSDLFDDETNVIDGFAGARTVHIGIDLDGPLGTPIYAFTDGIVHSAGYNEDLGDYGNVIVIEHDLGNGYNGETRKIWALYGHLDNKSIKGMKRGKKIKKGKVIGRFGDIHENGGWCVLYDLGYVFGVCSRHRLTFCFYAT